MTPFCRVFVPRIFGIIFFRYSISTDITLQLSTAVSSGPALGLLPSDTAILQSISTLLIFGPRVEKVAYELFPSVVRSYGYIFFLILFIVFALLFSFPPSRNTNPGSHSRLFPPTHYGSCLAFISREDFSSFFPRTVD